MISNAQKGLDFDWKHLTINYLTVYWLSNFELFETTLWAAPQAPSAAMSYVHIKR